MQLEFGGAPFLIRGLINYPPICECLRAVLRAGYGIMQAIMHLHRLDIFPGAVPQHV
jgi:hypothetical protein